MKFLLVAAFLFLSITELPAQETPTADTIIVAGIVFEKTEMVIDVTINEWRCRLEKHLVPVIKKARKKLNAGCYTVNVRLLIERDGSISAVQALNDPGYGIAEGAENVLKGGAGPKWVAAEPNSTRVRSYPTQSIKFQIQKK